MCMVWPCHSFVDGLSKHALMCIKVKLINHDCVPILMLLHIMPYIMLTYLTLFAALSNAVGLYNAFSSFFAIDFCKCFLFSCFVLVC